MRIHRLSEGTINRIAAGEVIERPASVVKELVENALDAGATQIDVAFRGGGKSFIRVTDNGSGMAPDDLALCIERHATSKLSDGNLIDIRTLGFRGEALPSIASVSRMSLSSRLNGAGEANVLRIESGQRQDMKPASLAQGTEIEVRDLFYATPARLKFLKADRTETAEAADVVRRLALAHPATGFTFVTEERRMIDAPAGETREARVARIMGSEFRENAVAFMGERENVSVQGFAGLPTYSRAQGNMQFAFVNGRPVRDKLIAGRHSWRLRGSDVACPVSGPCLVSDLSAGPRRRERPPRQIRSALPRQRLRPRPHCFNHPRRTGLKGRGLQHRHGARHGFKLPAHDVTHLWRFCRTPGRL